MKQFICAVRPLSPIYLLPFFVSCTTLREKPELTTPIPVPQIVEPAAGSNVFCLDVHRDYLAVYPGGSEIRPDAFKEDRNPEKNNFEEYLAGFKEGDQCHILIRPGGSVYAAAVQKMISSNYQFDMFKELVSSTYKWEKLPDVRPKRIFRNLDPLYIEINQQGGIFYIPTKVINELVEKEIKKITERGSENKTDLMNQIYQTKLKFENYRIDLTYFLTGMLALFPMENVKGYDVEKYNSAKKGDWLNELLTEADGTAYQVACIVRSTDEAVSSFHKLKAIVENKGIPVSFEMIANFEPIKFGLGGQSLSPQ